MTFYTNFSMLFGEEFFLFRDSAAVDAASVSTTEYVDMQPID